jgi:hypothetical protein
MIFSRGFLGLLAFVGPIVFGLSWLYWLHEIAVDVNKTLPKYQRVEWGLLEKVPRRMHWLWKEHARLFPHSRKRIYAALCLVFFFVVPITAQFIRILIAALF